MRCGILTLVQSAGPIQTTVPTSRRVAMKRCPQCEFVYEDDQSLCDMDGILLVFDSQKLPKPNTPASSGLPKPQARSRVYASLAALVLAMALYFAFNGSSHQSQAISTT